MRKPNPKNVAYKNQFNTENYDRINIMVPKGQKDAIGRHAREVRGYKSTNLYVTGLIQADMGLTDDEWKNPLHENNQSK